MLSALRDLLLLMALTLALRSTASFAGWDENGENFPVGAVDTGFKFCCVWQSFARQSEAFGDCEPDFAPDSKCVRQSCETGDADKPEWGLENCEHLVSGVFGQDLSSGPFNSTSDAVGDETRGCCAKWVRQSVASGGDEVGDGAACGEEIAPVEPALCRR